MERALLLEVSMNQLKEDGETCVTTTIPMNFLLQK